MLDVKKEILFVWLGDKEPTFTNYTLDNFSNVNKDFKITYVHYNNDQIKNYNLLNDKYLSLAIKKIKDTNYLYKESKQIRLDTLADYYELIYTEENKCFYFDLDCFPISSLNNFYFKREELPIVYRKRDIITTFKSGSNIYNNIIGHRCPDIWGIITTNYLICSPIQIYKNTDLNKKLISHLAIICNENHKEIIDKRRENFLKCNIKLGDVLCNPELSPVEHYYSKLRNTIYDK